MLSATGWHLVVLVAQPARHLYYSPSESDACTHTLSVLIRLARPPRFVVELRIVPSCDPSLAALYKAFPELVQSCEAACIPHRAIRLAHVLWASTSDELASNHLPVRPTISQLCDLDMPRTLHAFSITFGELRIQHNWLSTHTGTIHAHHCLQHPPCPPRPIS